MIRSIAFIPMVLSVTFLGNAQETTTAANSAQAHLEAEVACCEVEDAITGKAGDKKTPLALSPDLRNLFDPLTGVATKPDIFLVHGDIEKSFAARIHFSSAESLEKAKQQDAKALYTKAYLNGDITRYGQPVWTLENKVCPVSGVGSTPGTLEDLGLKIDPGMSVNCEAGACSVGDGFFINYNAVRINTCRPACAKMFAENPERFFSNIKGWIAKATPVDVMQAQPDACCVTE